MELELKKAEKDDAILEIKGEDHTFCNALRRELWESGNVDAAGYTIAHSLTASPVLVVKAKDPKKALETASMHLREKFKELKGLFKKK
ncbi:MAG TPA: DNA-directed RNA polymerase subunit L [Candidatus Nanoarchaeia archaeon]|nr:DNA-directed RNA polymerase subunit L [Candidatus Nanoarchaeia archaeon]